MDEPSSSRSPLRWMVGVAAVGALWWVGFENGDRVPLLTYVNLGIHEFGHFATHAASDLVTALAGSVAQVAVPLVLAGYFLLFRGDWLAVGLCLAWGATSALEVAIYVADAPDRDLPLLGGTHDWAFILGPEGYDAIERSGSIAGTIRDGAWAALIAGFVFCLLDALRAPHPGQLDADAAATSRSRAASTP